MCEKGSIIQLIILSEVNMKKNDPKPFPQSDWTRPIALFFFIYAERVQIQCISIFFSYMINFFFKFAQQDDMV